MKTLMFFVLCALSCHVCAQIYSDTLVVQGAGSNFLYDTQNEILRPVSDLPEKSLGYFHEMKSPAFHSISFSFRDTLYQGAVFRWWQYTIRDSTQRAVYSISWDSRPTDGGYILYPICWSSEEEVLYMYSQNGDMYDNEQGVFSLNIKTGEMVQIIDESLYLFPPIINRDRTAFFFLNHESQLCRYDIAKKTMRVLLRDRVAHEISWMVSSASGSAVSCDVDVSQPEMVAPFTSGTPFCVTRMGFDNQLFCEDACTYNPNLCSPAPFCEGHCQAGCVNCRNAVDVDITVANPTFTQRRVRATAPGFVIRAMQTCPMQGMGQGYGFGYHVVIRHGDIDDDTAPETLYAHLSTVSVQEGQYVFAYQPIGELGNTQVLDCDGDGMLDCECVSDDGEHLHYEYHNGSAALYGASDIDMPVFSNTGGCVLQPNNSYVASNLNTSYLMPNSSVSTMSYICLGDDAIVILTGSSCGCCVSTWHVNSLQIPGDTLVLHVSSLVGSPGYNESTQVFGMYRTSQSPCAATTSASDILIPLSVVFENCGYGCTNPAALNYDPEAVVNDGSCQLPVVEPSLCTVMDLNADGVISFLDISIFLAGFQSGNNQDGFGDVNQDGVVTIVDLFTLIVYFGQMCD